MDEKEEKKLPSEFLERFESLENQVAEIKSILVNIKSAQSKIEPEKLEQVLKKVEESVDQVEASVSDIKEENFNIDDKESEDEISTEEESNIEEKSETVTDEIEESIKDEQIKEEKIKIEDDPFKRLESSNSSNFDSKKENTDEDSKSKKEYSEPETKKNNYIEFIKKFFLMASIVLILICGSSYLAIYAKDNVSKLLLILFFSTVMTYIGFQNILKGKKNVLSFFMSGIGSGLYLIAILASHFAFEFIDSTSMLVLAGFWSWAFIYSYKYTKQFFIVAIAYAGALFASFSGIGIVFDKTVDNYWLVYCYLVFTGIYIDYFSKKYMTLNECKVVDYMNLISGFALVLFALGKDIYTSTSSILLLVSFYLILRDLFIKEKNGFAIFFSVFFVLLFSLIDILNYDFALNKVSLFNFLKHKIFFPCSIYFAFNACIFWLANKYSKFKQLVLCMTGLASGIFVSILFGVDYHLIGGMSIFMIIPVILDNKKEEKEYTLCVHPFLILDLLIFSHNLFYNHVPNVAVFLLFIIVNIIILYSIFNSSWFYRFLVFYAVEIVVCVFLVVYIGEALFISSRLKYDFFDFIFNKDYAFIATIFSIFTSCFISFLAIIGWFKEWRKEIINDIAKFALFALTRLTSVFEGKFDYVNYLVDLKYIFLFNMMCFINFIIAISCICNFSQFYILLLILSFSSALLYLQSCVVVKFFKNNIWICGLEGFLLFWIVVLRLFDLSFVSPFMSLVGFIFGFICVYIGFNIRAESLRILGLVASLLMILKFIIFDSFLGYSDVLLAKTIATGIGGLCCLGITWIYGKLEKMNSFTEQVDKLNEELEKMNEELDNKK